MKQSILFLISIFTTFTLFAQDNTFTKANKLYNENKYNEAITLYKKLLTEDKHSATLYFNIGNCYYKEGKLPAAILNYERAKLLSPADEDINNNLGFVNAQISDKIEAKPQYFIIKWVRALINKNNSNTWAYISCGLWTVLFVLLFLFVRSKSSNFKKTIFPFIIFGFLSSFFSIYATYSQYNHERYDKHAIVFASSSTIQSTPSINGTELFVLHEGTKVKVLDKVGSWYNIQLPDERQGWIPCKDVKKIVE